MIRQHKSGSTRLFKWYTLLVSGENFKRGIFKFESYFQNQVHQADAKVAVWLWLFQVHIVKFKCLYFIWQHNDMLMLYFENSD